MSHDDATPANPEATAPAAADHGLLSPMWAGTRVAGLTGDHAVAQAMLDVEHAWVEVLAGAGWVPDSAVASVAAAADAQLYDLPGIAARSAGGGNPLIPLLADLRSQVSRTDPEAAAAVHRGATSQDIVDTSLLLLARRSVAVISADLRTAADALADLADTHRATLCAARTLTQHSLGSTFGLRAARWLSGITETAERLARVADELPLQWGGAAGTMAATADFAGADQVPGLTTALAERLGLTVPALPWQTNPDPVTELGQALADVTAAAGRIANDVLMLGRPEIGEIGEPLAAGRGGSSAMPQKQNPVLSVLIRSAALTAPGALSQLQVSAATGVDERADGAWHVQWQSLRELLRHAGGAAAKLAELASGLRVHPERMRANLELTGPLVVAERIMGVLAPMLPQSPAGTGKQQVQRIIDDHLAGRDHTPGDLRRRLREAVPHDRVDDAALDALLAPENYLGTHDAQINAALARHRATH